MPGEGPDFICIGMAKSGTGWLYDQLRYHADFWMPPIKEFRYLNQAYPKFTTLEKQRKRARRRSADVSGENMEWDSRADAFVLSAQAASSVPRDISVYSSLFRHKGKLLSGDISPTYSALDDDIVASLNHALPNTKIVLLVRDPVARAWSHLSMHHRRERFHEALLEDPAAFKAYFESSGLQDRAFPSRILARWRKLAPDLPFRYFFFDDIEQRPEWALGQILAYLGANADKKTAVIPAAYNHKANRKKLALTPPIQDILVRHFAQELHTCAEVLGGHAQNWPGRYDL